MSEARVIDEMEEELIGYEEVPVFDDISAEMVLRRLRTAEDQYESMKAWYDAQISKLKDIRDKTRTWAENCLRPYMDMVPTTGKKRRTYEMRGGTLTLAAQDPEYKPVDDELVPWLKKNGLTDFIKVTEEAKWGDLKDTLKDEKKKVRTMTDGDGVTHVVTEDGEIVPGVTVVERDDKFSIKLK